MSAAIQRLYIAYFGRPADPVGLQYWVSQNSAPINQSIASIAANFALSPEYTVNFTGLSSAQSVNNLYLNLFGRAAEPAGLLYWAGELTAGRLTISNVALAIANGAQAADLEALNAKITAATAFSTALADTSREILGYNGAEGYNIGRTFLAGVTNTTTGAAATTPAALTATTDLLINTLPGQTYTLTSGIDTLVGTAGNDTFNASNDGTNNFFSALDSVNGGAGRDTLNVALATGGTLSGAGSTVTGIEIANIVSSGAVTAANVSTWTGLTTLNVAAGGAIAGVVAASTADINVANGLAGVSVNGGKNVTVVNGTAGNVAIGLSGTGAAAAGDVTATNRFATGTIDIRGAGALTATGNDGAITFINGTSVTATASAAVALATRVANVNAQSSAASANTSATTGNGSNGTDASGQARTDAAAVVTDLATLATAITNATNVSANQTTALSIQLATKAAYDNGTLSLADKVAIDAAFLTGLATSVAAARTAAQAVLTPLQTAATTASAAAAAADVINDATVLAALNAANAVVAADVANAGLVDGVGVTATSNSALTSATVSGNYGASNTITDGSVTSSALTSATVTNAGNSTLTGNALTSVTATGQTSNVSVTNSTVGHTQNFTLSGITAGTYTDNNATTINIVSNGAATNVLTGLSGAAATKINVSGAAGVNFGTLAVANAAVIDASANSGTNTITLANAGQQYIGGSGTDNVTAQVALQTATVDGGAGTADRIAFTNAATFATTGASKFLNFETLRLTGITADVTAFTGSTFTSVQLSGAAGVTGLAAGAAANVTALATGTYNIGITGASTVGQLDTVNLTVSDGSSTRNTLDLGAISLTGVETLNLVATDNITITGLANALALTSVKVTGGAGVVNITSGAIALNVNTVIDASVTTRSANLDFAAATANGVSLIAGNGDSTLTGTDIAGRGNRLTAGDGFNTLTGGQADDIIVAGNGNNTVVAAAGNNTVTLGNGDNSVTSTGGNDTITVGNGINVISSGAGNDRITVGTGSNLITAGAGSDTIVFGTHAAGVINGLILAAADSGAFATTAALASAASTGLSGLDVITGLRAGDTFDLTAFGATITGTLGTTLASGTGATAALTRGNYDATTGIFTASSTGTSSLLSYDVDGSGAGTVTGAIVLVGSVVTGSAAAGLITLA